MSNRDLEFTQEAETDLRDILQFTEDEWGLDQKRAYANRLLAGLEQLQTFPNLGRVRSDFGEQARSYIVEEHVVFYRVSEHAIVVSRIVHRRMDRQSEEP